LPEIDYASVNRYWEGVTPSILGTYMMDGFGFPVSAGDFRFRAESRIVRRLTRNFNPNSIVLDFGSGVGYWAKLFAQDFSQVVAVEGSRVLYQALKKRCAGYPNVRPVLSDALSFELNDKYDLVFLGGLLMYLDESDVIALLQRLAPCLEPGGIILCRESTVRGETVTRDGEFPVVYRSVSGYRALFKRSGFIVEHVERNEPYVLMQMACELIKKWKEFVPSRFQALRIVGPLAYGGMRLGNPWITCLPRVLGISFPKLENHFFVLGTGSS
jgi:SAM-dependent methyltransferase